ncbi:MAG: class I SAM-dependent methyltransferase [Candidatus Coatesbacteria bacterium]|nr:MAG: class I SAM-dependent methyltransferase [Candidatus Coatesbacteria bacterium]
MFEYVDCNLCGANDYRVLYPSTIDETSAGALSYFRQSDPNNLNCRIVVCNRCGLAYSNPREKQELLNDVYRSVEDEEYLKQRSWKEASYRWNLARLERHVAGGRLLDFGCGHGFFLSLLGDRWDGYGVEPARAAARYASEIIGQNVYCGFLDEHNFDTGTFDAVTMFHVLEHVANPKGELGRINGLLKPGGYVYLEVPDLGSVLSRWRKRRWWYIMRFHTYYFTRSSLLRIVRAAGFELVDVHRPVKTWSVAYLTRKATAFVPRLAVAERVLAPSRLGAVNVNVNLRDILGVIARKERPSYGGAG